MTGKLPPTKNSVELEKFPTQIATPAPASSLSLAGCFLESPHHLGRWKCADSLAKTQRSVTGFDRPHENEQGNRKPFHRVMAIVCGALSGAPGLGCSPRPVNLHTTATFRLTAKLQQLFQLECGNKSMKTIVPDPPLHSLHTTAHSGSSLFSINPGVTAQEALQQISLLLKGAELNADDISSRLNHFEAERLWSVIHNVEMARAVVDGLLAGVQPTQCASL